MCVPATNSGTCRWHTGMVYTRAFKVCCVSTCVCVCRRQHTDVYRKDDVAATDTYYFLDPRDALATSSLPGGCLRSLSWRAAQIRELFFLTASSFLAVARHPDWPAGSEFSTGFSHGKTIAPAASVLHLHPKREITRARRKRT